MKIKLKEKKIIVGLDGRERVFWFYEDGTIYYNIWKNNKEFGATQSVKVSQNKYPKHTTKEMLMI